MRYSSITTTPSVSPLPDNIKSTSIITTTSIATINHCPTLPSTTTSLCTTLTTTTATTNSSPPPPSSPSLLSSSPPLPPTSSSTGLGSVPASCSSTITTTSGCLIHSSSTTPKPELTTKHLLHTVFKVGETLYSGPAGNNIKNGGKETNCINHPSQSSKHPAPNGLTDSHTSNAAFSSLFASANSSCKKLCKKYEAECRDLDLQCSQRSRVNGTLTTRRERCSSGLVVGCKAGPKSRVKVRRELQRNIQRKITSKPDKREILTNGVDAPIHPAFEENDTLLLCDTRTNVDKEGSSPECCIETIDEDPLHLTSEENSCSDVSAPVLCEPDGGDVGTHETSAAPVNEINPVETDEIEHKLELVLVDNSDNLSVNSDVIVEKSLKCSSSSLDDSSNDIEVLDEQPPEIELVGVRRGDSDVNKPSSSDDCECVAVLNKTNEVDDILVLTPANKTVYCPVIKSEKNRDSNELSAADQVDELPCLDLKSQQEEPDEQVSIVSSSVKSPVNLNNNNTKTLRSRVTRSRSNSDALPIKQEPKQSCVSNKKLSLARRKSVPTISRFDSPSRTRSTSESDSAATGVPHVISSDSLTPVKNPTNSCGDPPQKVSSIESHKSVAVVPDSSEASGEQSCPNDNDGAIVAAEQQSASVGDDLVTTSCLKECVASESSVETDSAATSSEVDVKDDNNKSDTTSASEATDGSLSSDKKDSKSKSSDLCKSIALDDTVKTLSNTLSTRTNRAAKLRATSAVTSSVKVLRSSRSRSATPTEPQLSTALDTSIVDSSHTDKDTENNCPTSRVSSLRTKINSSKCLNESVVENQIRNKNSNKSSNSESVSKCKSKSLRSSNLSFSNTASKNNKTVSKSTPKRICSSKNSKTGGTQTTLTNFVIRRSTRHTPGTSGSKEKDSPVEQAASDVDCEDPKEKVVDTCASSVINTSITSKATAPEVSNVTDSVPDSQNNSKLDSPSTEKLDESSQKEGTVDSSILLEDKTTQESLNKSKEMVRLVQDHTSPFESYCRRRSNRASRRLCSTDTAADIADKKKLRNTRKTTVNSGSRSDYYSESEESFGGDDLRTTEKVLSLNPELRVNGISRHVIEKMATRRNPRAEEDIVLSPLDTVKLNGEAIGLINGTIKSHTKKNSEKDDASDDSDCGSHKSKVNGMAESGANRVDFNMLLEISVAERNKFEKKRAKKRKINADWSLISETEKLYNERQEILRNKNKQDSSTDDDVDSDDSGSNCRTTRIRSKLNQSLDHSSEDSDSNISTCLRKKRNSKSGKEKKTSDNKTKDKLEEKVVHEEESPRNHQKLDSTKGSSAQDDDTPNSRVTRGRPMIMRNRKPIYDLTHLHEDTDDDNFYSFPVNSGLGNSPVTVFNKNGRSSRSKTSRESVGVSKDDSLANNKKRLSDAERFLRDNKEYYQFPETRERLRTSHEKGDEKTKPESPNKTSPEPDLQDQEEEEEKMIPSNKVSSGKKTPTQVTKNSKSKRNKLKRKNKQGNADEENDSDMAAEENSPNVKEGGSEEASAKEKTEDSCHRCPDLGNASDVLPYCGTRVDNLSFSFEKIPDTEPWYQTYQRQLDGVRDYEYWKEEDPLKFVLPYEMPKEYFRDHLNRRNLANKKKADLAELVRKSPRCHASTMALFSDVLPSNNNTPPPPPASLPPPSFSGPVRKKKGRKPKVPSVVNIKEEEQGGGASDGTSTPGMDSNNLINKNYLGERFETLDDYLAIEHCMNLMLRAAAENREITSFDDFKEDVDGGDNESKDSNKNNTKSYVKDKAKEEASDLSESEPKKDIKETSKKKNAKRKRPPGNSNSNKSAKVDSQEESFNPEKLLKELNLQDDPLAKEIDPSFLIEMKDCNINDDLSRVYEGTLSMSSLDLLSGSASVRFLDSYSGSFCDDLSSIDDFTEASSECTSVVDSENLDTVSHVKSTIKKRRKNLTGWPKTKRRRLPVTPSVPVSDDNDSALGFDDHKQQHRPKIRRSDILPRHVLEALDQEIERRSSSRKSSVHSSGSPFSNFRTRSNNGQFVSTS